MSNEFLPMLQMSTRALAGICHSRVFGPEVPNILPGKPGVEVYHPQQSSVLDGVSYYSSILLRHV